MSLYNAERFFNDYISKLNLIENERVAIIYFQNLGDFYSLCSSIKYVESQLNKEFILLYYSDRHKEIIDWFEYDGYAIQSYRIPKEDYDFIQCSEDCLNKYQNFFISWRYGEEDVRRFTRNISSDFKGNYRTPIFPKHDIKTKYSSHIVASKTVLMIVESNAIKSFPLWFWNFAAQIYQYMGFSVIFNADPSKSTLYNGKCILIPLSEIVDFVNECGYVFGVRCGLFDILSTSTANMIIFSTKGYAPLDRIFHIPNDNNRIKTFYYEDCDPYFKKTHPIDFVSNHFESENYAIYRLLNSLCLNDADKLSEIKTADKISAYSCFREHNRYVGWRRTLIPPFVEIEYMSDICGNRLILQILHLSATDYRFDYTIYLNSNPIISLNDAHTNCLSFPLSKSGEYYIKATLTELQTSNQEFFETQTMIYTVPVPNSVNKLRLCTDFHSYIVALDKFRSYISIYISSRDAHTDYRKNKNTGMLRVLKLLGLTTDFESTYRYSYIGVIDGGKVVKELLSQNQTLTYTDNIDGNDVKIESSGWNVTHSKELPINIEINGDALAVNKRGLNFVVWDKQKNRLIDSVCFDILSDSNAYRN